MCRFLNKSPAREVEGVMQRIACILSVSVFVIVVVAVPLVSQTPAFEVVSIKPNVAGPAAGPARVATEGGRFVASNAYLKMILLFAYRPPSGRTLRNSDIVAGPQWADMDRFDIEAKASRSTSNNGGQPIPSDPMGPTFATAIEEQLGLKLESARGPVEVLIIDTAERPSPN